MCRKSALLKGFRDFREITAIRARHAPKPPALPAAPHPDLILYCVCMLLDRLCVRVTPALPVATKALPSLARLAWQSPSCCHSLRSLHPPPAALPSLPNCATPGQDICSTIVLYNSFFIFTRGIIGAGRFEFGAGVWVFDGFYCRFVNDVLHIRERKKNVFG